MRVSKAALSLLFMASALASCGGGANSTGAAGASGVAGAKAGTGGSTAAGRQRRQRGHRRQRGLRRRRQAAAGGGGQGGTGGSGPSCPTGRVLCGTECVDTTADPRHCGGCGVACGTNQVCATSGCQAAGDCRQTPCAGFSYCDLANGQCKPGCALDTPVRHQRDVRHRDARLRVQDGIQPLRRHVRGQQLGHARLRHRLRDLPDDGRHRVRLLGHVVRRHDLFVRVPPLLGELRLQHQRRQLRHVVHALSDPAERRGDLQRHHVRDDVQHRHAVVRRHLRGLPDGGDRDRVLGHGVRRRLRPAPCLRRHCAPVRPRRHHVRCSGTACATTCAASGYRLCSGVCARLSHRPASARPPAPARAASRQPARPAITSAPARASRTRRSPRAGRRPARRARR